MTQPYGRDEVGSTLGHGSSDWTQPLFSTGEVGATGQSTVRWDCHAHPSGDCSMAYRNGIQYHIIPVKEVSVYTQTHYNRSTDVGIGNEFWEAMPSTATVYMTAVANCDLINDYEFVRKIFLKFAELDGDSLIYSKYTSAGDMVKRHLLTDCLGSVALCNTHLLRRVTRKTGDQVKYTSAA